MVQYQHQPSYRHEPSYRRGTSPIIDANTSPCEIERNTLLVDKKAILPKICVKTGQTQGLVEVKRDLTYTPPWVYILLLVNLIVCIIVALITQKKGKITYYVHYTIWEQRKRNILITWAIMLVSIAAIFAPIFLEHRIRSEIAGMLVIAGFVGILVAIFYGVFATRIVYPNKIDKENMWLKGIEPRVMQTMVQATQQPPLEPENEPEENESEPEQPREY